MGFVPKFRIELSLQVSSALAAEMGQRVLCARFQENNRSGKQRAPQASHTTRSFREELLYRVALSFPSPESQAQLWISAYR